MSASWQRANTDWLHQAKWGVCFHYLADLHLPKETLATDQGVAQWNRLVDDFDVAGLVHQLQEIGAGYFLVTIGQFSGYYCSPNTTYDVLVSRQPSRLSRRDLIADLGDALNKAGLRLLVYLHAAAPGDDPQAVRALRCTPPWDASIFGYPPTACFPEDGKHTDERLTEYQHNLEAIIREWSLRWGRKVNGWWIDACYAADKMYRHPDAPNFRSFATAMKAGNPASLVAFNPGVRNPVISHTEYEDYTAGEISNTLPTNGEEPCVLPVGRWVNGAQYHILSFLAGNWAKGQPRFTNEMVAAYTRYVNAWGGVITWDVPHTPAGLIAPSFLKQLRQIRAA